MILSIYLVPPDFDRLLGSLVNRTGLHIRRAVVVECDGPLYYDGPIAMRWDEKNELFLLDCEKTSEVCIVSWEMRMDPQTKRMELETSRDYHRIDVFDSLTGVSE